MAAAQQEYSEIRERFAARANDQRRITIEAARANKQKIDWTDYTPPVPKVLGVQVFKDFDMHQLIEYIDWSPFFHTWELAGRYPRILTDEVVGVEATKLFADAEQMLEQIIEQKLFTAHAVVGLFPAAAIEDDIELYTDDQRSEVLCTLSNLRQQTSKIAGRANHCLTDYIAPKETGIKDYMGTFAVTTGFGVDELAAEYEADFDDYNSIMAKALADRLAEAFAEMMHGKVRREYWGYAAAEQLDNESLIKEKYQGIRPAPGYPACPDHTEKAKIWELLDVEQNIGLKITESFAMYPVAAVSGWYFSHPQSQYFGVAKISEDQVEEYAQRKGMSQSEMERWLSPNLGYEPE